MGPKGMSRNSLFLPAGLGHPQISEEGLHLHICDKFNFFCGLFWYFQVDEGMEVNLGAVDMTGGEIDLGYWKEKDNF